jgi:hypothetical protein
MLTKTHLTTCEVAKHHGVADWQARRAVDALDAPIPRAGLYRLVPIELLDRVREQLVKMGYLASQEDTHVS